MTKTGRRPWSRSGYRSSGGPHRIVKRSGRTTGAGNFRNQRNDKEKRV